MGTRQTIERWVDCFNAGDYQAIAALYAEEAVNPQIALEPVVGRASRP
jgi:ketosteroid isomerase-like protein